MGMKHNRALVSKTDILDIRERCFYPKAGMPKNDNKKLEWLEISQGKVPVFDDLTQNIETIISKINGKYDISYKAVSI